MPGNATPPPAELVVVLRRPAGDAALVALAVALLRPAHACLRSAASLRDSCGRPAIPPVSVRQLVPAGAQQAGQAVRFSEEKRKLAWPEGRRPPW